MGIGFKDLSKEKVHELLLDFAENMDLRLEAATTYLGIEGDFPEEYGEHPLNLSLIPILDDHGKPTGGYRALQLVVKARHYDSLPSIEEVTKDFGTEGYMEETSNEAEDKINE